MAIKTREVSSSIGRTASSVSVPRRRSDRPRPRPAPYPSVCEGGRVLIRRLPNLQNGRLESVLLPVLATNLVMAGCGNGANSRKMGEEKNTNNMKKSNNNAQVTVKKELDFDNNLVFVKQEQPDYEEYAGSTDDEAGEFYAPRRPAAAGLEGKAAVSANKPAALNKPASAKKVVNIDGTKVFIKTLLHALKCGGCGDVACQKMRLVLGHFLSCSRHRQQQQQHPHHHQKASCPLCSQLIGIVVQHAKHLCDAGKTGQACPVPMCDAIREELQQKNSDGGGDQLVPTTAVPENTATI